MRLYSIGGFFSLVSGKKGTSKSGAEAEIDGKLVEEYSISFHLKKFIIYYFTTEL